MYVCENSEYVVGASLDSQFMFFLSLNIISSNSHVAQHNAMSHDMSGGSTVEWHEKNCCSVQDKKKSLPCT